MAGLCPLECPECRCPLAPRPGPAVRAEGYADCLRACDACGVGWSNAGRNPTAIYRNPLGNLPAEVRSGADAVLAAALNQASGEKKWSRLGFSTSEDAVTWTVFRYLQQQGLLRSAMEALVGAALPGVAEPALLLWGAPPDGQAVEAQPLRQALLSVSEGLKEGAEYRTEPDVAVWFPEGALLLLEMKYLKGSAVESAGQRTAYPRYVRDTEAFRDAGSARASRCYELVRNWRVGWELAGTLGCSRFHLGLVASPRLLAEEDEPLQLFSECLAISDTRRFRTHPWPELLGAIAEERREPWFARFLASRGLGSGHAS